MAIIFDWWEEGTSLKVVWRCVKMDNGRQSVTEGGVIRKQELVVCRQLGFADHEDAKSELMISTIATAT
jgi:hypothetical protein